MTVEQGVSFGAILFTLVGVFATVWQKEQSEARDRQARLAFENRAEWWRRWELALGLARSEVQADRVVAAGTIRALAMSPLITESELGMIEVLGEMLSLRSPDGED